MSSTSHMTGQLIRPLPAPLPIHPLSPALAPQPTPESGALTVVSQELEGIPLPLLVCPTCYRPFPSGPEGGVNSSSRGAGAMGGLPGRASGSAGMGNHSGRAGEAGGGGMHNPLLTDAPFDDQDEQPFRAPYFRQLALLGPSGVMGNNNTGRRRNNRSSTVVEEDEDGFMPSPTTAQRVDNAFPLPAPEAIDEEPSDGLNSSPLGATGNAVESSSGDRLDDSRSRSSRRPTADNKTESEQQRKEQQDDNSSAAGAATAEDDMVTSGYYKRYFVEVSRIGHGAFGGVYVCRHEVEGHILGLFAVKKVPIGNDAKYLGQVLKEVRVLEEVRRHPNVIEYNHSWIDHAQIADFGPTVRCVFILMEYATEGSLDSFLEKHGAVLSDTAVWYFFLSVVCGLSYLHSKGILHRDLKPQNLLLTKSGGAAVGLGNDGATAASGAKPPRLMVGDFGTSTLIPLQDSDPESRTGGTGTLEYMAPELLQTDDAVGIQGAEQGGAPQTAGRKKPDPSSASSKSSHYRHVHTKHSDMWSLGMILHYLAFEGRLPTLKTSEHDSSSSVSGLGYHGDDSSFFGFSREASEVVAADEGADGGSKTKRRRAAAAAAGDSTQTNKSKKSPLLGLQQRPKGMTDLIKALLHPTPSKRPTCDDILSFPPAKKMVAAFETGDWHQAEVLAAGLAREASSKMIAASPEKSSSGPRSEGRRGSIPVFDLDGIDGHGGTDGHRTASPTLVEGRLKKVPSTADLSFRGRPSPLPRGGGGGSVVALATPQPQQSVESPPPPPLLLTTTLPQGHQRRSTSSSPPPPRTGGLLHLSFHNEGLEKNGEEQEQEQEVVEDVASPGLHRLLNLRVPLWLVLVILVTVYLLNLVLLFLGEPSEGDL